MTLTCDRTPRTPTPAQHQQQQSAIAVVGLKRAIYLVEFDRSRARILKNLVPVMPVWFNRIHQQVASRLKKTDLKSPFCQSMKI